MVLLLLARFLWIITNKFFKTVLKKDGQPFVEATTENALNGTYPLTRFLYVYVNKKPNQPLAPLENEFIKLVLSKSGQQVVIKDGYIPLPAKIVEKVLNTIK